MPQSARARLMTVLQLSITKSARNLYDTVHQFILDMKLVLINPALFDPTVNDLLPLAISGIRSLFEDYLLAMTAASKSDMISDAQGMSIVANCYFLAEDLFPRIKKQLAGKVDMKRGTLPFRLILGRCYLLAIRFVQHCRVSRPAWEVLQGAARLFLSTTR